MVKSVVGNIVRIGSILPLFSSREARTAGGAGAFLFCPPRIPLPHVQPVSPAVCRALTASARLATTRRAKLLDNYGGLFR